MPEMTYAVHTTTCTYLLDDDGVCRWTLAPGGLAAPGTDRCVGAQFVACLDLSVPGGLVGELVVGGAALFAHLENGRLVLLRTPPIQRVEYRAGSMETPESTVVLGPSDGWSFPPHEAAATSMGDPLTEPLSMDAVDAARAAFASLAGRDSDAGAMPLDLEDFLSVSVTEVTVTLPLYRAAAPVVLPPIAAPPRRSTAPPPPAPPPTRPPPPPSPSQSGRRGMIGPGRRLR